MMNKKITTILCLLEHVHDEGNGVGPTPTNEIDVSEMAPTSILPNDEGCDHRWNRVKVGKRIPFAIILAT
nr:hypothetical protein [Tanacetum cinerariifolium]